MRFALCGHSQGGGLATLMAMSLSELYPRSPINLYTFSSPPVISSKTPLDPLEKTQIRHYRFGVDNDMVCNPPSWLQKRHVGSYRILMDGRKAEMTFIEAHSGVKYDRCFEKKRFKELLKI